MTQWCLSDGKGERHSARCGKFPRMSTVTAVDQPNRLLTTLTEELCLERLGSGQLLEISTRIQHILRRSRCGYNKVGSSVRAWLSVSGVVPRNQLASMPLKGTLFSCLLRRPVSARKFTLRRCFRNIPPFPWIWPLILCSGGLCPAWSLGTMLIVNLGKLPTFPLRKQPTPVSGSSLSQHVHGLPGNSLPKSCFGRARHVQPVKQSVPVLLPKPSRPGEEEVRHSFLCAEVNHWFKQFRRLQSMRPPLWSTALICGAPFSMPVDSPALSPNGGPHV